MNLRRGRELEEYAIDLPCSLRDEGKEERRIDLEKAIRLYEIYLAAGRPGERELLKSELLQRERSGEGGLASEPYKGRSHSGRGS